MSATVDSTAVDLCRILRRALREFCYKFLFCISFRALCSTSRVRSGRKRSTNVASKLSPRGPGPGRTQGAACRLASNGAHARRHLAQCKMLKMHQTDDTRYTQSVGTDTYQVYVFITAFSRSQASIHLHTLPNSIAPHAPICAPCYCLRARATRSHHRCCLGSIHLLVVKLVRKSLYFAQLAARDYDALSGFESTSSEE